MVAYVARRRERSLQARRFRNLMHSVPGSRCRCHAAQTEVVNRIVFNSSRRPSSTQITRSALVPFSSAQMYRLVADVPAYPQFLPWCRAAEVHAADDCSIQASLTIAKGPVRKRFTTLNRLVPKSRIEIELVDGPFRHLHGSWLFEDLGGAGARVTLKMDFEIAGSLLRRTMQPIFAEIVNTLVDAFCRRARDLYGA